MTDQKLTQLLEQLLGELSNATGLDDKSRELLRALNADIESLLERSGESRASLLERLEESIERFEESHPALTATLAQLLNALNNAGI